MFKMSVFRFDAGRESIAKAQNRFADCSIRQNGRSFLIACQPLSDPQDYVILVSAYHKKLIRR